MNRKVKHNLTCKA